MVSWLDFHFQKFRMQLRLSARQRNGYFESINTPSMGRFLDFEYSMRENSLEIELNENDGFDLCFDSADGCCRESGRHVLWRAGKWNEEDARTSHERRGLSPTDEHESGQRTHFSIQNKQTNLSHRKEATTFSSFRNDNKFKQALTGMSSWPSCMNDAKHASKFKHV